MAGINIADVGIMTAVVSLISVCIRNLINDKKSGIPSCGARNCSSCAGCKLALQKRK